MTIDYKKLRMMYTEDEINSMCINAVAKNISSLLKIKKLPAIEVMSMKFDAHGTYNAYYNRVRVRRDSFNVTEYICGMYLGKEEEAIKRLAKGIRTLCHELRHTWQHEFGLYKGIKYISPDDKALIERYGEEAVFEMYEAQPSEVDANYWAERKGNQLISGELTPEMILAGCFFLEEEWQM